MNSFWTFFVLYVHSSAPFVLLVFVAVFTTLAPSSSPASVRVTSEQTPVSSAAAGAESRSAMPVATSGATRKSEVSRERIIRF